MTGSLILVKLVNASTHAVVLKACLGPSKAQDAAIFYCLHFLPHPFKQEVQFGSLFALASWVIPLDILSDIVSHYPFYSILQATHKDPILGCALNTCSIVKHVIELHDFMFDHRLDLIVVTVTWLNET